MHRDTHDILPKMFNLNLIKINPNCNTFFNIISLVSKKYQDIKNKKGEENCSELKDLKKWQLNATYDPWINPELEGKLQSNISIVEIIEEIWV